MTPQAQAQTLEDFLMGAADALVLEDGMVAFDLAQAKYSISGETHVHRTPVQRHPQHLEAGCPLTAADH